MIEIICRSLGDKDRSPSGNRSCLSRQCWCLNLRVPILEHRTKSNSQISCHIMPCPETVLFLSLNSVAKLRWQPWGSLHHTICPTISRRTPQTGQKASLRAVRASATQCEGESEVKSKGKTKNRLGDTVKHSCDTPETKAIGRTKSCSKPWDFGGPQMTRPQNHKNPLGNQLHGNIPQWLWTTGTS